MPEGRLLEEGIMLAGTAAIWFGSSWLESASETLSTYYGLPTVVQGAIGSSMPELASVVIAALEGSFGLGVGAIVGSAIFNVLEIPAVSGVATDEHLESSRAGRSSTRKRSST